MDESPEMKSRLNCTNELILRDRLLHARTSMRHLLDNFCYYIQHQSRMWPTACFILDKKSAECKNGVLAVAFVSSAPPTGFCRSCFCSRLSRSIRNPYSFPPFLNPQFQSLRIIYIEELALEVTFFRISLPTLPLHLSPQNILLFANYFFPKAHSFCDKLILLQSLFVPMFPRIHRRLYTCSRIYTATFKI